MSRADLALVADIGGTNFSAFDLFALVVSSILVTLFIVQTSATARMLRRRGV